MKERSPRNIHGASHYVAVRLSTREEPIHLVRPLPWAATDLLIWMSEVQRACTEELAAIEAEEEQDEERQMWRSHGIARRYSAALEGRIIGILWAHMTMDLEACAAAHDSPEAMGLAVYEELWASGWSPEEIQALAQGGVEILVRAAHNRISKQKVDRFVLFGGAEDSRTTPMSAPASNTSATQEDSIA